MKLADRDVLELEMTLTKEGWTAAEYTKAVKHKPYTAGSDKVWYLHPKATAFNRLYFMCLLTIGEHKLPVYHDGTVEYYRQTLLGKTWVPKQPKIKCDFDYDGYNAKAKAAKPKVVSKKRVGCSTVKVYEKDCGKEESDASDSDSDSTSSSSSFSSSSDSESSSSSESKVDDVQRRCGGKLKTNNQSWYGFRFTYTFPKCMPSGDISTATGIEAKCIMHGVCRKRMAFKKWGGHDKVEQRLKYWCTQCKGFAKKDNHRKMEFPLVLPALEKLEDLGAALHAKKIRLNSKTTIPS